MQAERCLEIIADALAGLDASLSHVVRTRIMLRRMEDWERVEVCGFADPDWLIEIEADAVVDA